MKNQRSVQDGNVLPDQALILVAVMPSPRDLEIARVLGWYRIPYQYAPKIVYVDYVAFYQPLSFGNDHANRVEFIAPVRGVELTTRHALFRDEPDHPRAKEEYYKIQIGALLPLSRPIHSKKWKRITFLYTTGSHLKRATVINDLVVKDEDRKTIWRSLRERREKFSIENSQNDSEFEMDDILLTMLGEMHGFTEDSGLYIDY